jgi:ribosomal protein L16 Arg81 hydroxylase
LNQLREIYKQKHITLIAFSGYGADSKSFKIHKDKMDVIYLQVYGEIIWSVWESDKTTPNIQPEQGTCVFKQKFVPGDMIYIPAGTFHHVEHLDKPRIGFSFGNA